MVATSGLQQASERVDATNFSTSVNVRMQGVAKPADGVAGNSISIAQYRVPAKAREAYRKAHEAVEKGKMEDAHKHLAKALELCPNYAEALTLQAVLALNQRDSQSAVADLDKALQADGNYAMAYLVMGSALNMQGKFDDAITQYHIALAEAPGSPPLRLNLGLAYYKKQDFAAAAAEFASLHQEQPGDITGHRRHREQHEDEFHVVAQGYGVDTGLAAGARHD